MKEKTERPGTESPDPFSHIEWIGDATTGCLRLLDQTELPESESYLECRDVDAIWHAIARLSVRGAPAIGIAAAYGYVIGARHGNPKEAAAHLNSSRPTAVNLAWALDRMERFHDQVRTTITDESVLLDRLLTEAQTIHDEDREACRSIGEHGLKFLRSIVGDRLALLTHCNAGSLATGGIGTATAPMYVAHEKHVPIRVFADETRPLLQGARLTAYELSRAGIEVTLITDSTAATVLREGRVNAVITGADRIVANGDAANKIGTYPLAVMAHHHQVPFIVAAPTTTFDLGLPSGDQIPIEERAPEEVTKSFGRLNAPADIEVYSPAFDITPSALITALVTERGVISPVTEDHVRSHLA